MYVDENISNRIDQLSRHSEVAGFGLSIKVEEDFRGNICGARRTAVREEDMSANRFNNRRSFSITVCRKNTPDAAAEKFTRWMVR